MSRTLTGWVSFCLLAFVGVALGQEPLRVETVRAAWKEREAKVRTARFEWKQTVFTVKGSQYDARTGPDGKMSRWEATEHGAGVLSESEEAWGACIGESRGGG